MAAAARCRAALAGFPQLRCIRRMGHAGDHEAVDLPSRTTYRWHEDEEVDGGVHGRD